MLSSERASLTVEGGPNRGAVIPLSGRPLTLGRRSDNDIFVDDSSVSRRHALVMETAGVVVLRDLNSSNDTFVGGDKIGDAERPLKHGDRIRLAGSGVTFIFRQEGPGTLQMSREPETDSMPASVPQESAPELV